MDRDVHIPPIHDPPGRRDLRIIVLFEYVPESIYYHPALERVRGVTILESTLNHLKCLHEPKSICILAPGFLRPEVSLIADACVVAVVNTVARTKRMALVELARSCEELTIAVLSPWYGVGFLPDDLLSRMTKHHIAENNSHTHATDLPAELSLALYSRSVLVDVCSLPISAAPEDPMEFLRLVGLAQAGQQVGERALSTKPFSAADVYNVDLHWTPRNIKISLPEDANRLTCVLHCTLELPSWIDRLRGLRDRLIADAVVATGPRRTAAHKWSTSRKWRSPPRVLYVSLASGYSGAEECLANLIKVLNKEHIEAHALIVLDGRFADRLRTVETVVMCAGFDFSTSTVNTVVRIKSILKRLQPSIVHVNGPSGMPIMLAAHDERIPLVYHARTVQSDDASYLAASAQRIVAVSEFVARRMSGQYVDMSRVRVVYDGVDCSRYHPSAISMSKARERLGLPPHKIIILCVARFSLGKRHDVLIEAYRLLRGCGCDAHLLLVGEKSFTFDTYESCRRQITASGLDEYVTVLGFQRDIRWVEAASDIVVLCSEQEALGTVALESMAMGKAVVVSDSGGLPEVVVPGDTGMLVKTGDVEDLCRVMCLLARSAELRMTIGERAVEHVAARFSIEASAAGVVDAYREAARF